MMQEGVKALIKYRIERARETYEEALLMGREQHWNACLNRLYYACFYAVTALLAKHGLSSSKHSGVKSFFNQRFIKTGLISRQHGSLYNHLFENRQEGDYVDFVFFDDTTVEPLIPKVDDFIKTICGQAEE